MGGVDAFISHSWRDSADLKWDKLTLWAQTTGKDPLMWLDKACIDQAKIDEWVRMTSEVANKNLGPFYTAWGFPTTQSVLDSIASRPAWAEDPMNT